MPRAITHCGDKNCAKGDIKHNTKALQCDICSQWWHIECAEIAAQQYEVLKTGINGAHWYCLHCNVGSLKVLQKLTEMQTELKESKATVTALKSNYRE